MSAVAPLSAAAAALVRKDSGETRVNVVRSGAANDAVYCNKAVYSAKDGLPLILKNLDTVSDQQIPTSPATYAVVPGAVADNNN